MEWPGIIAGIVVLLAFLAVTRVLRRLVFAFALAAGALLLLHMQEAPGEAGAALAAMGGGLMLARPVRRMLTGGWL